MLKSLTTSRNVTSVCHFRVTRVTRPNNHLANIKAGWEKVATDIFTLDDKNYLCTVDYYSGSFEMDKLHSKTGTVIIKKLKKHFVTHGAPNELLSDNLTTFCGHLGLSM